MNQKKTHILVLMAGDGKRFSDVGYKTPKPLIPIHGKTILEWTTKSLPFIKHYGKSLVDVPYKLTFATRKKHNVDKMLKNIYGHNIGVNKEGDFIQGNLRSALLACLKYPETDMPLLVLDADNMYDSRNFFPTIEKIQEKDYAVICYFFPVDESEKWCFAKVDDINTGRVTKLSEKKKIENAWPMVGLFYFSSQKLFVNTAKSIIDNNEKMINNEYYMSQAIQKLIDNDIPVYGFEAPKVFPLGTPEDLEGFAYEFF